MSLFRCNGMRKLSVFNGTSVPVPPPPKPIQVSKVLGQRADVECAEARWLKVPRAVGQCSPTVHPAVVSSMV